MYKNILGASKAKKMFFDISKDEVLQAIEAYVVNKTILDLGCVEHKLESIHKDRIWVHDFFHSVGKRVVGVDYMKDAIDKLKEKGYNVRCQNVENLEINGKFDIVFAGEIIEHLNNPGLFLSKVKKALNDKGLFILTTPNAFSVQRFISIFWHRTNDPPVNPEHTCYYTPHTLRTLLERYGFKIKKIIYAHYPVKKLNLKQKITKLLCSIVGEKFKETMIVIATLD